MDRNRTVKATDRKDLVRFRKLEKELLNANKMLPLLDELFKFLLSATEAVQPMMTKMMIQMPDSEPTELLTLWVSCGDQTPLQRIEELKEENKLLKEQLEIVLTGKVKE